MVWTLLKILCTCTQSLEYSHKILEKEKYISHTITPLMIFTRAFCHMHVENLLKGPVNVYMGSTDPKDAFFSVPIHNDHQKYLKFVFGNLFQFTSMLTDD